MHAAATHPTPPHPNPPHPPSVCNHITVAVPSAKASRGSASLVIAHGLDWSEVTPESLLMYDNHTGAVLEGSGKVEVTAFQIHSAIHRELPDARVVIHTHMPYATALAVLSGEGGAHIESALPLPTPKGRMPRLRMVHQNCLRFFERIAYDDEYNGIVTDPLEGERIARALRGKSTMFMANHGVMVTGRTVSEAWHELYVWWVERDREATERQTNRGDRDDIDDIVDRPAETENQRQRSRDVGGEKIQRDRERCGESEEMWEKHL